VREPARARPRRVARVLDRQRPGPAATKLPLTGRGATVRQVAVDAPRDRGVMVHVLGAGKSRGATTTTDVEADPRDGMRRGAIRAPCQPRRANGHVDTTRHGHDRLLVDRNRVVDPVGVTVSHRDVSSHNEQRRRSDRSRSRLHAVHASPANKLRRHRGSAISGLTTDRCGRLHAKPQRVLSDRRPPIPASPMRGRGQPAGGSPPSSHPK
jgi:hypothetical protein